MIMMSLPKALPLSILRKQKYFPCANPCFAHFSTFRLTRQNLLCTPATLQSFSVDNPQFHPSGNEGAPRPYQGLDMRKVCDAKFESPFIKRKQEISGYQFGNYSGPSVHAPTHAEIVAFFHLKNWQTKYSYKEIAQASWPQLRALLMFVGAVLIPVVPFLSVVFYLQQFEPMETFMPNEEYFQNFRWNYFGPHLDEHAYSQYLEARRAKKWRGVDVDLNEYIPSKYRGQ